MKFLDFISFFLASICTFAAPQKIIIDTDMGNDVDDALALAILYNYQKHGKADTKAILVNKGNKYAPLFCASLNDYYGFANLPIGYIKDGKTPSSGVFIEKVVRAENLAEKSKDAACETDFADAPKLARKILAASEDKSVVYISLGFLTNAKRLLESKPDKISPLSGMELIAKKVKYFSVMGGNFKDSKYAEYNINEDIESAQKFAKKCPVDIIFSGFEVGENLRFPHKAVDNKMSEGNPAKTAYNLFARSVSKSGRHDRPTWDLTSVLYVFEPQIFELSQRGKVKFSDKATTIFSQSPKGNARYIILPENAKKKALEKLIETAAY